jgi:hypothetical protein
LDINLRIASSEVGRICEILGRALTLHPTSYFGLNLIEARREGALSHSAKDARAMTLNG